MVQLGCTSATLKDAAEQGIRQPVQRHSEGSLFAETAVSPCVFTDKVKAVNAAYPTILKKDLGLTIARDF